MTSHVVYNILTYWKIVYIFTIIKWNHLKLCMCILTTKLISKTKLFVFSSVANSLELLLVEQILTDLANSKRKFDVIAKSTIPDNEYFFQRDVEVWELYFYYCQIKTWTMFFTLVVMHAHAKFQVISYNNLKDNFFQYVKMLCTTCVVMEHLI